MTTAKLVWRDFACVAGISRKERTASYYHVSIMVDLCSLAKFFARGIRDAGSEVQLVLNEEGRRGRK